MSSETRRILVADDDQIFLDSICQFLSRKGYFPTPARDGEEALRAFKRERQSAVLTDYSMPKINGEALVEQIRQLNPSVPILLMTGILSDSLILDMLRFDRFAAIHKPFKPEALLAALDHVFSLPHLEASVHSRKAHRVDIEIPLRLGDFGNAISLNVSSIGMFIGSELPIPVGETLTITFELPKPIELRGQVIWRRELSTKENLPAGIGVRFTEVKSNAQTDLKNLLMAELKKANRAWFSF